MGCGCNGSSGTSAKFELTTADGSKRVFLTESEARAALSRAGGGTIQRVE